MLTMPPIERQPQPYSAYLTPYGPPTLPLIPLAPIPLSLNPPYFLPFHPLTQILALGFSPSDDPTLSPRPYFSTPPFLPPSSTPSSPVE